MRGRASSDCAIEQVAAGGAAGRRQHVAFLMRKAQGVFELTQIVGSADQHIGIGADSQSAFAVEKDRRRKRCRPPPTFVSVTGQTPATAPLAAMRRVSSSFVCVAWIKHQRPSTGA